MHTFETFLLKNNLDITLVVSSFSEKKIVEFVRKCKEKKILDKNGLEVFVLLEKRPSAEMLNVILENPFVNWKIFQKETNSLFAIDQVLHGISKSFILFISELASIDFDALIESREVLENEKNLYIISEQNSKNNKKSSFALIRKGHLKELDFRLKKKAERVFFKSLIKELRASGAEEFLVEENQASFIIGVSQPDVKTKRKAASVNTNLRHKKLYDWMDASYGRKRCEAFLRVFKKSVVCNSKAFQKRHRIIALVQTYNEISNISSLLNHLNKYCDGVILLDDDSNDGTFEAADSSNLILKVQKTRSEFNDLENRNLLLDLVSFFKVDWLYFIDADERFDPRYNRIFQIPNLKNVDVVAFRFVDLWNNPKYYRVDFGQTQNDGVFYRPRMVRNVGHLQINLLDSRKLHFPAVPPMKKQHIAKILILHFGALTKANRIKKYDFYMQEDKTKETYENNYKPLLEDNITVRRVSDIKL